MTVKVKVKDFPKVFKEYSKRLGKEFELMIADSVVESIPDLTRKSPVDTGEYASSWVFDYKEGEKISIGNHAPHSPMIEYGARPFIPPIKPLLAWAKRVLKDQSQPPRYSSRVWQLAIGTRNKIRQHGLEPKHILTDEIEHIISRIKRNAKDMEIHPDRVGRRIIKDGE